MRRLFLLAFALVCVACTAAPASSIGSTPAATPAPTLPPTATVPPPIDLSPYRAAMKPEFAAEVDRFAAAPQYEIDLTAAPDLSSYAATQQVRYTNAETASLKEIYFTLFPNLSSYGGKLKVESVKVNGEPVTPQFKPGNILMKIDLPTPLQPGEAVDLELEYSAQVPVLNVEHGYNQFGLHDGILTLPNFYPQIPAYDDEGWNISLGPGYGDAVFSDTALYRVDITAPSDQVVATSGSCTLAEAADPSPGSQTWHCVSGPMRDFMIAMSPDYQVKSATIDGVKVNSYFRKQFAGEGARGLQVVSDALKAYSQRIGAYPFAELDLIATPTTAGGIEYPGLIVVAEGLSKDNSDFYEGATAHEAAHQWWYSLVGNDQVDEPWLDEALTQFTAALYYRDVYGLQGLRGYVGSLEDRFDRVKGTAQDKRSDRPVADYSPREYGAIVYGKAALFFNALYNEIGDEKFNQLLQDYFKAYRYQVAYPQDFLKVAEDYVGQARLDELLKEWITTP
jgi:hypothetical protein